MMGLGEKQPLPELRDEQLVEQYRNGDISAFTALVDRYRQELFHYLARLMNNRSWADDVFQETFLQVHLSIETFDIQRRFRPWLFTIATNKARDQLRRNRRTNATSLSMSLGNNDDQQLTFLDLMESDAQLPEENAQHEETLQRVRHMITGLPDPLREILLLAYFHRFSYNQIAEMLEIPVGTVKSRLHTAVGTFAKRWKTQVDHLR